MTKIVFLAVVLAVMEYGGKFMRRKLCLLVGILAITLFSCVTINKKDPYPKMNIVTYENNTAYEFSSGNDNKLIIYLEGSGYHSVMGIKNKNEWQSISFGYFIIQALRDKYAIIIPEKFNRQLGMNYYTDPAMIEIYTLNNLVENYSKTINAYLSDHNYSSVVLIGSSEGAAVLPFVYEKIIDKESVKSLVAISYGGLSRYEQMKILADSTLDMPSDTKTFYKNVDRYREEVRKFPDSLGSLYGLSYVWYNEFFDYSPFDYYLNINIPILFIHGETDINVPVESTRYIQEQLPNKPFEYYYFENTDHNLFNKKAIKKLKTDGVKWVIEHS